MKKRFRYIAIKNALMDGTFGPYLASPVSDKTRKLIISERLSFLRQQAELSQRDLCEIIGIAVTTYSGYEQGKHEPSLEIVCRLASLYHISADFILGVGYQDAYSDSMMMHFCECGGISDISMQALRDSMTDVDIEEYHLRQDLSGVDLPHTSEFFELEDDEEFPEEFSE